MRLLFHAAAAGLIGAAAVAQILNHMAAVYAAWPN